MDIQEVRIDEFECWQRVRIPLLASQVQAIQLEDGGRAVHFAKFLHGLLFGFAPQDGPHPSGALVVSSNSSEWCIDRRRGDNGKWRLLRDGNALQDPAAALSRLRGEINADVARHFLFPAAPASSVYWNWLRHQEATSRWLFECASPAETPVVASQNSIAQQLKTLQNLAVERDALLASVVKLLQQARAGRVRVPQQTSPPLPTVDMENDLRILQRRAEPWRHAAELSEKWLALNTLRERITPQTAAPDQLRIWWDKYRELESSRESSLLALKQLRKRSASKPSRGHQDRASDIRQLLEQRVWVQRMARLPDTGTRSVSPRETSAEELEILGEALRVAERERDELERRGATLGPAIRRRAEAPSTVVAFAADNTDANRQLAELQRRRLWVREERNCLVQRQRIGGSISLALALLFSLGLSCVFGLLLTRTIVGQWVLTCVGLGALVATGAIKMAIQRRNALLLAHCQQRLARIDEQIAQATPQVGEMPAREATSVAVRQPASRVLTDCCHRIDRIQRQLEELCVACGLPRTLSAAQAAKAIRQRSRRSEAPDEGEHSSNSVAMKKRLRQWIKKGQRFLREAGQPDVSDPIQILDQLEEIYRDLRDRGRDSAESRIPSTDETRQVRRELKRIDTGQQEILDQAQVEDGYALESAVEKAERNRQRCREVKLLDRELQQALAAIDRCEEVRELLEVYSADDIQERAAQLLVQQQQLQHDIAERKQQPVPAKKGTSPQHNELDRARLKLAVLETRIRALLHHGHQVSLVSQLTATIGNTPVESFASEMLKIVSKQSLVRFKLSPNGTILLEDAAGNEISSNECPLPVARTAWLAAQLAVAQKLKQAGKKMPVVLLADDLEATALGLVHCVSLLARIAKEGQQILILTHRSRSAQQMSQAGIPVLRIGLEEVSEPQATPQLPQSPLRSLSLPNALAADRVGMAVDRQM